MLAEYTLWRSSKDSPTRVLISPLCIAAVTEEGHHPPAVTIETRGGSRFLVRGNYDDVKEALAKAQPEGRF